MTNKEWMSTLTAEQFYDKMMWLMKEYGMRFNNTRLAVIAWLNELHEEEPTRNKTSNALNALDCVEERKKGEWDMFDLISSAYYGKGMYFKQDNGTVYSRHSGEYMTVDEAIREFISLIDIDELTDRNVGKWIPVTERLPKTKADSIRAMTDEELADLFISIGDGNTPEKMVFSARDMRYERKMWLDWLKEEANDE